MRLWYASSMQDFLYELNWTQGQCLYGVEGQRARLGVQVIEA
jgi:hypothetical protein